MVNTSEFIFNTVYLTILIAILNYMIIKLKKLNPLKENLAKLFIAAFVSLLLGDSAHLITRIIALTNSNIPNASALIGFGSFLTAIGFTIFFALFTVIWGRRFNRCKNVFFFLLILIGIVRFIILLFPQNNWLSATVPRSWSLLRNAFLMAQGFGVGAAFMISSKGNDKQFNSIGLMFILSFIAYLPTYVFPNLSTILIMICFIIHTICYIIADIICAKWFKINSTPLN